MALEVCSVDDTDSPPSVLPTSAERPWRSAPMQKLYNWLTREDGQTMAEYGVVLAVITIAVFGALALLSGNIVNAITRVAGFIS
jgi:Flp pilus assembly pilin Flp